MHPTIRTANPDDWQTIQELNAQVFTSDSAHDPDIRMEWPFQESGERYFKRLCNGTYGACLVAESEGVIVGYAALAEKEFGHRKSRYLEIENIGVRPEYRSQGVGKALMDRIRAYAKEQGYAKLFVAAYWGNTRGRAYYESCGFAPIGIEMEATV
jgi:ribosomal protein S18 acetylase RimI-like enzyme